MKRVLTIPIYDATVYLSVTKRLSDIAAEYGYGGDCSGADGITFHFPSSPTEFAVVLRKGCTSPGVIAHEAYHLTKKVMNAFDLVDTVDNHETGAYLMGFIVDLITQAINGSKD